ncbi:MAG TPA: beta-propeller fold lactonase family protein [Bryobacteraceae bacterium]|nr:beta-propeller fold lactonase family protein [Bryobacteraceae bacterium]
MLRKFLGTAAVTGVGIYLATSGALSQQPAPQPLTRFAGPTSSQPLALDGNGTWLVVANPDHNSVTFFDVAADRNRLLREIPVGKEPNGVAVNPLGTRAYVANTVSGTISVLNIARNSPLVARVAQEIKVGTEPYGLAMTPNGTKLYVTNRRSNSVSVIDTATNRVIKTIENIGFAPTGIAITNNGDADDDDELVYVTQFFALPRPGRLDGEDDSKQGKVSVIRTVADEWEYEIDLLPIGDTGFKAAGDAIARVAPPATITEADLRFTTSAYPNQLNSIFIKGNYAYVPNTGASPNGPVRFDANTQSLLCVIDRAARSDSNQTINMHTAVRDQATTPKLFLTQPWAIAAKHSADEAYVVSTASDTVVKLALDRGNGSARVLNTGATPTRVLQIPTGKQPRGIVINNTDTRAYVMNYVSRTVTVINIQSGQDAVLGTMRSAALPTPGSLDDMILAGKELYHSSRGEFDGVGLASPPIRGRMSNNGWGSCGSCHPDGLSDNVVWLFGAGPRRTISQHQDFDPDDPTSQRALNWSGIFDEQEDFEANIRGTSGGLGLIVGDDGITPSNPIAAFTPASGGERRQLRIRGFRAWDAIKAYIQFGIRAPLSPIDKNDPDVIAGEQLFRQSNCQSCHGGNQWTTSRVNFTPPPGAGVLSANGAQIIGELKKVGTFDASQKNEVRQNAAAPLGTDGYVPPSLLGLSAFPQTFFHNGSANSLEQVMANVAHRSAGTGGTDLLNDDNALRQIIQFIKSIDSSTPPIPPQ